MYPFCFKKKVFLAVRNFCCPFPELVHSLRQVKKDAGGCRELDALTPHSVRPLQARQTQNDSMVVDVIWNMRIEHQCIVKEKLKPLFDAY
jgi:hypothetical protein